MGLRRDFPVLQHPLVVVHALQPHAESPQAGDVLDHLLGAVVERAVVLPGVPQGQRAVLPADFFAAVLLVAVRLTAGFLAAAVMRLIP